MNELSKRSFLARRLGQELVDLASCFMPFHVGLGECDVQRGPAPKPDRPGHSGCRSTKPGCLAAPQDRPGSRPKRPSILPARMGTDPFTKVGLSGRPVPEPGLVLPWWGGCRTGNLF